MRRVFIFSLLLWSITTFLPTPAKATGELKSHQLNVGGKNRSYLVYKPESCANIDCPVLFMFHGLEGSAQQAAGQSEYDWQNTADKNNFLVVFPESLTVSGKSIWGIEYDPPGKHWDIGRIDLSNSQRCSTQDVNLVKQLIDSELNNAGYQPLKSHIFSTGHSYGAFFSFFVSTCLPDKITAFASHSGGMVSYFWYTFPIRANSISSASTPGIVLSSSNDPIVSHQWSINLVNELKVKKQVNQFIVLDSNLGHNWDKSYNQTQWDFFMTNSDPLPEPEPPATVNFATGEDSAPESSGIHDVGIILEGSHDNISVAISFSSTETAIPGDDFLISADQLNFKEGETEKNIQIHLLADEIIETDETIILNLKVLSGNAVVGENTSFTFTIHDDTILPPLPETKQAKFLIAINNYFGIVWKKSTENVWDMLFDYGKTQQKFSYTPTQEYEVLDIDASWKKPDYFWWTLWQAPDGKQGLWRRAANQEPNLDRLALFTNSGLDLRDFVIARWGIPFVLWSDDAGNATIQKYSEEAKLLASYKLNPPAENWQPTKIIIDNTSELRILWQNLDSFMVERYIRSTNQKIFSPAFNNPIGFKLKDIDTGWSNSDRATRILFTNDNKQAKIWKINLDGTISKQFDFDAPENHEFIDFESISDNRIQLMLGNSTSSETQIWKINQNDGKILEKKDYTAGE